ncbi:CheR family methyltransferase [Rubellimicrobium roseum]|uniref:PAS domain S-box protein n=1 Tax=Rubellimicrobium roseum TaxID=687525 RepID=A0A5C4N8A2_9RHOB|nr:CheR family methyltransferase [Rubellimicrobium roseum]TNC65392.1 PAS domain S-box protein [Rubellimicrobium roseum]
MNMSQNGDDEPKVPEPVLVALTASGAKTHSLEVLLTRLALREDAALVMVLQQREASDESALRKAAEAGGHELTEISDGARVEPGRTYLPPSGVLATVEGGRFRTQSTNQVPTQQGLIDSFLVSLAREWGRRAIAVALDGTNGDGTLGVQEVKAAGGLVLAEATAESEEGALAQSNEPAALADAVLPIDEITPRLQALLEELFEAPRAGAAPLSPDAPEAREALTAIAGLLRQKTGHDFHGYKRGTFLRRVQQRMQALTLESLPAYVETLRTSSTEAQDLFNDLLIGVTEFFRDTREWELLERQVVPRLFEGKGSHDALRVWVVGCSTGEEAYSLAILLAEARTRLDDPPTIQIFASDLDGRALAAARAGRYTDRIADQMTPERLGRWFLKEGDTYCVTKELREMCVFSQHSLIKDAPFSRLDLVSCRNLLIYLDAELQEQVIPLFHFALRPGGFLFLGNSENVSRHQSLFAPVESRSRIFHSLNGDSRPLVNFPFTPTDRRLPTQVQHPGSPPPAEPDRLETTDLTRWAEREAEHYAPAYVIVDAAHNVLHFSGNMGRYLAPSRGAASLNLHQLIHPGLRLDLRTALGRAAEEGQTATLGGLEFGADGHRLAVVLVVKPRQTAANDPAGFLVLFKEAVLRPENVRSGSVEPSADQGEHVQRLEDELRLTRDRLQSTIEELETTNEELKSSNEEYQSLNEELQSANEELETSKEELQSMNEELTTVNGELGHRVQELGHANSDLKNFLESTQIATLFLDNDLRVTNFTPASTDLFHLIGSDEGRPITHIKARIRYEEIESDARRVLRTLAPVEREVGDPATAFRYAVRVLPYRSTDNVIAGVVVTFVDVTASRQAEELLRASKERQAFLLRLSDALRAESDADALANRALRMLSDELRLDRCYVGVYRLNEDRGEFPYQVGNDRVPPLPDKVRLSDFPDALRVAFHRTLVIDDVAKAEGLTDTDRRNLSGLGLRAIVAASLRRGEKTPLWSIVAVSADPRRWTQGETALIEEVVERTWAAIERSRTEAALRESEERFRAIVETAQDHAIFTLDPQGRIETWPAGAQELFGWSAEEAMGELVDITFTAEDQEKGEPEKERREARENGHAPDVRWHKRKDGARIFIDGVTRPLPGPDGQIRGFLKVGQDVTERRATADRLQILVQELQHRTRNLLAVVSAISERTAAGADSLDDYLARFRARLNALGRVNALLSRLEARDRITFDQLILAELQAHGVVDSEGKGEQVQLRGPKGVRLRSSTVQTFALALHELATNALKYGALSRPDGHLDVTWDLTSPTGEHRLRVDWREDGVPLDLSPAGGPPPGGYGRRLIERALPHQLGAETTYELRPEGVRCTITVPVSSTGGESDASLDAVVAPRP